ncbi:MAG: hypothetical protein J6B54_04920 [Clostridia bacterium]|nr:hypothetical protein [Clostridia bacterium]
MTLTIGGFTHTEALQEGSLVIRSYGALRSSFRATLSFSTVPRFLPKVGQEILLSEDDTLIWGGILVEVEQVCHSTKSFTMTLRGQGYEQILQRFCLPAIYLPGFTPSRAVETIFRTYLNPEDGLTLGIVEEGLTKSCSYVFYPAKASSVFDRLANENGFVWWVDKEKLFHMRALLPRIEADLCIDLTEKKDNRLKDIQTFVYRSSTADYRNVQYVYNRGLDVIGNYIHVDRLMEMSERYGSGAYGASSESTAVTHQTEAQSVGEQILAGSCGEGEIEFTTDSDKFSLGQMVGVTAPVCGIETETQFCVTEIRAVYFLNRFRYTVTAKQTDTGPLSIASWERVLAGGTTN